MRALIVNGVGFSSDRNNGTPKNNAPFRAPDQPDRAAVPVYVIPTDEEGVIARHAAALLARAGAA